MRLGPESSPFPRMLAFPFGAVALAGYVFARLDAELLMRLSHCPLRDATGLPCPTCGGTLAAVLLTEGRIAAALRANPMVSVGLILSGLWILYALIATVLPPLRRGLALGEAEKRTARVLAVLTIALTWAWEIRRCGF